MRIALVQMDIAWEDKAANIAHVERMVARNNPTEGTLLVLPEMWATGFSMNVERCAEPPACEAERFMARMAAERGITVMGGVVARDDAGREANESVTFGPDGREMARYRKMHPFSPGGEAERYAAGNAPVVFPLQEFAVSPFICYDLRFPEAFRMAVRAGAQLFVVISSWPVARISHWVALLRARAIENQAWVAGVNRVGTDPSFEYPGRSMIVDPRGDVVAEAGNGEAIITADLSLDMLLEYRSRLPFLADMRADLLAP